MTLKLTWSTHSIYLPTNEALLQKVRELEDIARVAGELMAIEVAVSGPTAFGIVVGGAESYAQFFDSRSRPPVSTTIGPFDDNTLIEFDYMGESSELERRYWISSESTLKALTYYLENDSRDPSLLWN